MCLHSRLLCGTDWICPVHPPVGEQNCQQCFKTSFLKPPKSHRAEGQAEEKSKQLLKISFLTISHAPQLQSHAGRRRDTPQTASQEKHHQACHGWGVWTLMPFTASAPGTSPAWASWNLVSTRHTCSLSTANTTLEACGCILVDDWLLDNPGLGSRAERWRNHDSLLLELRLHRGPRLQDRGRAWRGWRGRLRCFHRQALELGGCRGWREALELHLAVGPLQLRLQGPTVAAIAAAALEGAAQGIRKQVWKVSCLVTDKLQHLCKTEENSFNTILSPAYFDTWHLHHAIMVCVPRREVWVLQTFREHHTNATPPDRDQDMDTSTALLLLFKANPQYLFRQDPSTD